MNEFSPQQLQNLTRQDRVNLILKKLNVLPPARNGLEAYRQISETINHFEDMIWGKESWNPPRSFLGGVATRRFYTTFTESFFSVENFPGVTLLLGTKELIFVSRYGAIEMQRKLHNDRYGKTKQFYLRHDQVFFVKLDAYSHSVWDEKNRT